MGPRARARSRRGRARRRRRAPPGSCGGAVSSPRPSKLDARHEEFIVDGFVGELFEALVLTDFALQRPDAAVLGREEHDADAGVLLLFDPILELLPARNERGDL